ncbi:NosD domain-containing protein [Haloferula sp. A504]|uniref:golvesin C-terminal-like domain-containing protein n=1 Tax=Haloferula sp. A504 TaxID=3373601 RepID=UPI0031C2E548|nr:right-handed parallel beta-helix repeat-containing protein [Verrucomicrobiaceae bacterium E54]
MIIHETDAPDSHRSPPLRHPAWVVAAFGLLSSLGAFGQSGRALPPEDAPATIFHVATTGDDGNPGTKTAPFATITRARDAIRNLKETGRFHAPVTVNVHGGTYHLAEPILLRPEDSGTPGQPVTYRAAPGEKVTLSGGVPIEGPWTETSLNGTRVFVTELTGTADRRIKQVIAHDDEDKVDIVGDWVRKGDYLHDDNTGKGSKSVTFRADIPEDGDYGVFLRWTQRDDAARRIPVHVRFDGGSRRYTVNQAFRGGWYKLGTHPFTAASGGAVIVRNEDTEGLVMAEAVMCIKADQERPWVFRQLFADGTRQPRARYPNSGHLYATGGAVDHMTLRPGKVKASWGSEPDAQVHIVAGPKFYNQLPTIASVDPDSGTVHFEDECFTAIRNNNSFHVEGIKSELDAPGEWYLDAPTGRLYFKPEEGRPCGLVAPRLNSIFRLEGDIEAGTHVEHVAIKGFSLRHTTYTLGQLEPRVNTDGAIILENARHCTITGNDFQNLGGYAVWLRLDSRHNRITENTARELGAGFLLVTGAQLSYMEPHLVFDHRPNADRAYPVDNTIADNHAHGLGRIRYYNAGVHLDSRPEALVMSIGNHIAHNTFHDLSRNGIFAFRNQGGNLIEYNHIHECLKETIDGAGIHFASMSKLNAPNHILHNHIHDCHGISRRHGKPPGRAYAYGIYLDWYTSYSTVAQNVIHDCSGGHGDSATRLYMGGVHNSLHDNTPNGDTSEMGSGGTAASDIPAAARSHTGLVISCWNEDHVTLKGNWRTVSKPGFSKLLNYFYKQSAPGAGAETEAAFDLPVPEDGRYDVFFFTVGDPAQASKAPVEIVHADGTAQSTLDTREDNIWRKLGNYRFATNSGTIRFLAEGADGPVVAHKVGLIKTGPNSSPPR